MPELPEVQIQVNQLRRLRGQRIVAVRSRDPKIRLPRWLIGQRIGRIHRRGKYIIFDLSNGRHLLAHLRMTGGFEFDEPPKWRAAIFTNDGTLYFEDSRRFGVLESVSDRQLHARLAGLGPEPLSKGFDVRRVGQTSRAIKVALLDQHLVAGLGNIYASESLWRARINPRRPANRLQAHELSALRRGIRDAMRKAIGYGPRIFEVQQFAVYGRTGKPCRRCGTPIRRFVQAQRSTYFCSKCQR
jgi:formamidopyrimidine-DNA glycosylase